MRASCRTPDFPWVKDWGGVWGTCTSCRRPAWSHEQADITTDIRNTMRVWTEGLARKDFPPAMHPLDEDGTILDGR